MHFLESNVRIWIKISLKFVPKGPINNNPVLVQIMAWRRLGDKPLSEPIMVNLLTHICVTWPQWVKLNHSLTFLPSTAQHPCVIITWMDDSIWIICKYNQRDTKFEWPFLIVFITQQTAKQSTSLELCTQSRQFDRLQRLKPQFWFCHP